MKLYKHGTCIMFKFNERQLCLYVIQKSWIPRGKNPAIWNPGPD